MEVFGRYELLNRIACGGSSEVFRAREAPSSGARGRVVVLKRLLPHLAARGSTSDVLGCPGTEVPPDLHEGFVRTLEVGAVGGVPYVTLEPVEGGDLATLVRTGMGEVPAAITARIVGEAAGTLAWLHVRRAHGDLSLSNVLVGFDGRVKLTDLGSTGDGAVASSATLDGSVAYLSPERVQGAAPSPASDQFALGIILWELLVGERLFGRPSVLATLDAIDECRVARPGSRRPGLDSALDEVAMRALERSPERRFPGIANLRTAVESAVRPASREELARYMQDALGRSEPTDRRLDASPVDEKGVSPRWS